MKITIHRGSHQIGGCVTEIYYNGYRVFIDLGEPLPGTPQIGSLAIEGLTQGDTCHSILLITHYHGDHIGELLKAQSEVPVYMGQTARDIYRCCESRLSYIPKAEEADKHREMLRRADGIQAFKAGKAFDFGPFRITPLMVDHSAFDSYMFVIEAGGIRLLYTGDFRGHGFRAKALPKMLNMFARHIDYVISEGTNVCRAVGNETERSLQHRFTEEFRQHKYNFVLTSSTNIDRIFSLYHAAYWAGRLFVCDDYQYKLMKIVADSHNSYTSFYKMRTSIFALQKQNCNSFYIPDKLMRYMKEKGFCMLIRDNSRSWDAVANFDGDSGQAVYYSMWKGYVEPASSAYNEKLHNTLAPYSYKYMHTSGHCDVLTLEKMFRQVQPRKGIIPIHTEHPERFETLFGQIAPVILLQDGESFECDRL